jgi:3-oxoacyl-[acyl-carrier protein] reductase
MTLSLARALAPTIRVDAIAPGPIDTRWLWDGLGEEGFQRLRESVQENSPLGRISTPEDVADAIIWLIEGAANMTGEVLRIDAGAHLGRTTVQQRKPPT